MDSPKSTTFEICEHAVYLFFLSAYLSACSLCLQACKYGILNSELVLYLSCDDDTSIHAITITVNNFETTVIFRQHCDQVLCHNLINELILIMN